MAAMIEMETHLEEIWGVKPRTARGYATIIVCAKVLISYMSECTLASRLGKGVQM